MDSENPTTIGQGSPITAETTKRLPVLPYEIFLAVVEAFLAEAEASAEPAFWYLDVNRYGIDHLIIDPQVDQDLLFTDVRESQRRRFYRIRSVLQLDKRTRAMAHDVFPVFRQQQWPQSNIFGANIFGRAWVSPTTDHILLLFNSHHIYRGRAFRPMAEILLELAPPDQNRLRRIESVSIDGDIKGFVDADNTTIRALVTALPSLKEVRVDGTSCISPPLWLPGPGDHEKLLSELRSAWKSPGEAALTLAPLWERGVRVFVFSYLHEQLEGEPAAELFQAPQGLQMKIIPRPHVPSLF